MGSRRQLIPSNSDDEVDYSVEPEFYDPNLDDKDELWVQRRREGRISDAVLSCPACFTNLCLDCQRHEKYVTKYWAMFAVNCKVITDQILRQTKPERARRKSKDHKVSANSNQDAQSDEIFWPVCCSVCSTEVVTRMRSTTPSMLSLVMLDLANLCSDGLHPSNALCDWFAWQMLVTRTNVL